VGRPVAARVRRLAVVLHRWLGIAGCLLCVGWFASGLVLLVAPYPGFRMERDARWAAPLDAARATRPVHDLLRALPADAGEDPARVGMLLDEPVLRVREARRGPWVAHPLGSDAPLPTVDAARAEAIARRALGLTAPRVSAERLLEADQWTVEFAYRREAPFWRLRFADADGTDAYVSERGGEVLMTSTARQRALAWVGAIPHWLYPRWLRLQVGLWQQVIVVASALCLAMTVLGLVVGVWHFRWRALPGRGRSPYARAWMRWHHWAGLLFGACTCTWLLSGLLSVDPLDWDPGPAEARHAWRGAPLREAIVAVPPADAAAAAQQALAGQPLAELELHLVQRRALWVARGVAGARGVVPAGVLPAALATNLRADTLARALAPAGVAIAVDTLSTGDAYVAPREGHPVALPVLRVRAGDVSTYVDPVTLELVARHDNGSRRLRWLYTGLHDLDLPGVQERPALRVTLIVLLSLGGLVASVSGVVVGWRRLLG
jgi:hypothetical protein